MQDIVKSLQLSPVSAAVVRDFFSISVSGWETNNPGWHSASSIMSIFVQNLLSLMKYNFSCSSLPHNLRLQVPDIKPGWHQHHRFACDNTDDGENDDPVDNSPFWWWLMSGVSWEELPNRSGRSNIVSDLHCSSLLQWLLSNHNNVDNTIRITGHSWNILRQFLEYVDCGSNCGQLPCCHTVHCTLHCTLYTPGL